MNVHPLRTFTAPNPHNNPLPEPKNGKWYVALLAGGPGDVAREIRDKLMDQLGTVVSHHWEWKRPRAWQNPIPQDVDFAILLKDMMGHADEDLVRRACKAAKVPFIRTQRKWSAMRAALNQRGLVAKFAPEIPLAVTSTAVLRSVPDEEPAPEPTPALLPEPVTATAQVAHQIQVMLQGGVSMPPITNFGPTRTYALVAVLQKVMAEEGVKAVMIDPTSAQVQL